VLDLIAEDGEDARTAGVPFIEGYGLRGDDGGEYWSAGLGELRSGVMRCTWAKSEPLIRGDSFRRGRNREGAGLELELDLVPEDADWTGELPAHVLRVLNRRGAHSEGALGRTVVSKDRATRLDLIPADRDGNEDWDSQEGLVVDWMLDNGGRRLIPLIHGNSLRDGSDSRNEGEVLVLDLRSLIDDGCFDLTSHL
jgi:hypothetical protein